VLIYEALFVITEADRSVTTILLPKSIDGWSLDGQWAAGPRRTISADGEEA
jgi:hypothetical protein